MLKCSHDPLLLPVRSFAIVAFFEAVRFFLLGVSARVPAAHIQQSSDEMAPKQVVIQL